ncbi:thioredoxin [Clostridium collagenovorans DSM 3089]|uniref:Thioredoxin n=1 Tax=Clostridium collagenovorans DSM 3089 TaxID=1121306 RepID=A0A1M5XJL9_9CLOT|nr:thioredoxin [Clostridium collagenovorans]SHH99463.1 thioredoxin [Clostridium collagenovorans DSM 3089]
MAQIIDSSNFKTEIENGIVVVDFFATWCGPCKMLAPVFDELNTELDGNAKFVKVDIDKSPELAQQFNVSSVPTILIFKNGERVESSIGFVPKDSLKSKIDKLL